MGRSESHPCLYAPGACQQGRQGAFERMFPSLGNRLLELARIPHGVTVLNVQGDYAVEHLDFVDETFDAVLCAHPLFSDWPDVPSGVREWRRVAKIGGTVGFIGYGENAFQPLAALFETRLHRYDIEFAAPIPSYSWRRLSDAETCRDLLRDAGCEDIEVHVEQLGTYLKDAQEWWDIVCDVNLQSPLSQLAAEPAQRFKAEHLSEVSALATSRGIWLNLPAIFAIGRKPGVAA